MDHEGACAISPIGWAIRQKARDGFTFVHKTGIMYRSNGEFNLLTINKNCQPAKKFKDWAAVSESNNWTAALIAATPATMMLEQAWAVSPLQIAVRQRTDKHPTGHIYAAYHEGSLPSVFTTTRRSKNPRRVKMLPEELNQFRDWKPLLEPFGDLLQQCKGPVFTNIKIDVIDTELEGAVTHHKFVNKDYDPTIQSNRGKVRHLLEQMSQTIDAVQLLRQAEVPAGAIIDLLLTMDPKIQEALQNL